MKISERGWLTKKQQDLMESLIPFGEYTLIPIHKVKAHGLAAVSEPLIQEAWSFNDWILRYGVLPAYGARKIYYLERVRRQVLTETIKVPADQ